jgi:transcriptional regulator with XRE-family HTH domain
MNAMMIGTNIKKLRDEHKVTQQQLARNSKNNIGANY